MITGPTKDDLDSSKRGSRRSSKAGETSAVPGDVENGASDGGGGGDGGEDEEKKIIDEDAKAKEKADKPRRSRAMSIAPAVAQFLSGASAKRRPSREPQFMTVSPNFTTRSTRPWSQSAAYSRPRHSIDIRNLPTYLARHRQSIVGTRMFESLLEGDISKCKKKS